MEKDKIRSFLEGSFYVEKCHDIGKQKSELSEKKENNDDEDFVRNFDRNALLCDDFKYHMGW